MPKKGYSSDNSACEELFGRMKNEIHYGKWENVSIESFIQIINEGILCINIIRIK